MTSASSRWPLPGYAGNADDLAGMDLEREILEAPAFAAGGCQAGEAHQHAPAGGGRLDRGHDLAPAHQLGQQLFADRRVVRSLIDALAQPHDHDAVGDGANLLQLVADQDHAHALARHGTHGIEQAFGFLRGQRRCRLVENEDARATHQRLDDLQPLLLADGEIGDERVRLKAQAELPADLGQAVGRAGAVEQQAALPDHEVFENRVARHEVEMLVHHADAECQRIGGVADMHGPAGDRDAALIGGISAEQDVHQRGLAGAVLAQQAQHIAGIQRSDRRRRRRAPARSSC